MTADIQHVAPGMGAIRERTERTDASDNTSESLEGKKASAKPNVKIASNT